MIYIDKVTRKTDLDNNDSISTYDGRWAAQQHFKAFETFFYFLKETRPKRILEIGTALGGFTSFLKYSCDSMGLDCQILSYDVNSYPSYSEMISQGIDVRVENIFSDDYNNVSQEVKDFIQSDGLTIVICDGGNKKLEFQLLSKFLKEGDFILGHDYAYDKEYFDKHIYGKIWNWLELTESDLKISCEENHLIDYKRETFQQVVWVCKMKSDKLFVNTKVEEKSSSTIPSTDNQLTFVTGLWDIRRGDLSENWARSYNHYLEKFEQLLKIDCNLIIFGDAELEKFVWERRDISNTQFIVRDLDWFRTSVPYDKIQEIRNNSIWINQSPWITESTQAKLEMYNPLVMSKMFLLHDAKIVDKFDSHHLFWIDAGITNTVHPGYFTHDKIHNKLSNVFNNFGFICFPYNASNEIHGFSYPKINDFAQDDVKLVARGGLFGGTKDSISDINSIYYNLLQRTLDLGYMGTEESIFSIMLYRHNDLIDYVEISENGLISKFCEDLKNENVTVKNTSGKLKLLSNYNIDRTALYVLTYNSPNQFSHLIQSMLEYDKDFIEKPKKFLLDNSTDESTYNQYSELCVKYGFEHIKKDNLGICGGRQFVAEHFDELGLDFYFFFEDDMFFFNKKGEVCKNGFNRFVEGLYKKSLEITKLEDFDFLKYNFSEFYGDNSVQWSWYNVPQSIREEFWPKKTRLPESGLDPNAPKTEYKNIISYKGLPYATGEIYYCNWPQIVTKNGNKKMFLDTKWAHPYEQTWMSHMYQLTKKKELYSGILLISPTEHNRFDHYDRNLRKES